MILVNFQARNSKLCSHCDDIPYKCILEPVYKERIATEIHFTIYKGCLRQQLCIYVTSQAMACSFDSLYRSWMSCSKQMLLHNRKTLSQPENRIQQPKFTPNANFITSSTCSFYTLNLLHTTGMAKNTYHLF